MNRTGLSETNIVERMDLLQQQVNDAPELRERAVQLVFDQQHCRGDEMWCGRWTLNLD